MTIAVAVKWGMVFLTDDAVDDDVMMRLKLGAGVCVCDRVLAYIHACLCMHVHGRLDTNLHPPRGPKEAVSRQHVIQLQRSLSTNTLTLSRGVDNASPGSLSVAQQGQRRTPLTSPVGCQQLRAACSLFWPA